MKKLLVISAVLMFTTLSAQDTTQKKKQEPSKITREDLVRVIIGADELIKTSKIAYANIDSLKGYSRLIVNSNQKLWRQNDTLRKSIGILIEANDKVEKEKLQAIIDKKITEQTLIRDREEQRQWDNIMNSLTIIPLFGTLGLLIYISFTKRNKSQLA